MKIYVLLYAVVAMALACCDPPNSKKAPASVTVEVVAYSGGSWGQYHDYTRIITDTKTGRRYLVTDGHAPVEIKPTEKP